MASSLTPRQRGMIRHALHRRHLRQVLSRPDAGHAAVVHLAARTFLPLAGGLSFPSPVVPLGTVLLLVLHWARGRRPDGRPGHVGFLRGYRAWFARCTATTFWDSQGAMFACDLGCPLGPRAYLGRTPADDLALARAALDLDRELQRQADHRLGIAGRPLLPPTLVALPRHIPVTPEATPMVTARAAREDIPWPDAWHRLRAELRVPEALCPPGLDLLDTRLCTRVPASVGGRGVAGVYHDLRGLLGRPTYNPLREGPIAGPDPEVAGAMRRRMPMDLAAITDQRDLLAAAGDPHAPLRITSLAQVQVWWPPCEGATSESFAWQAFGHRAELDESPWNWAARLGLPDPRAARPSGTSDRAA